MECIYNTDSKRLVLALGLSGVQKSGIEETTNGQSQGNC
jgi:hypothetical protein